MFLLAAVSLSLASAPANDDLRADAQEIIDDACTMCHSEGGDPNDPSEFDLSDIGAIVGKDSVVNGKPLIVPGNPRESYFLTKMTGAGDIDGDTMPLGDDILPAAQLKAISEWIKSLPPLEPTQTVVEDGPVKPFHGTHQIVLPTTTTLGKLTFQYRIDHRFGRIGTEQGFFGLDAGVVMSLGIAIGIFDGWDVRLRRTNSLKGWELATRFVPVRQEDGKPVSFGMEASLDWFRAPDTGNPVAGDFILMLSRLWFGRWSTMLTASVHVPANHDDPAFIDMGDGPEPFDDNRPTVAIGLASSVWLGKRKRWGIDVEYLLAIPDGATPNKLYYRGGDADPNGVRVGLLSIGGSYSTGKHFFQVFFTNGREIHMNLAAPGGLTRNPFDTPGLDSNNPFEEFNFYMGFNLGRRFNLGVNAKRWKKQREEKKRAKAKGDSASGDAPDPEVSPDPDSE